MGGNHLHTLSSTLFFEVAVTHMTGEGLTVAIYLNFVKAFDFNYSFHLSDAVTGRMWSVDVGGET